MADVDAQRQLAGNCQIQVVTTRVRHCPDNPRYVRGKCQVGSRYGNLAQKNSIMLMSTMSAANTTDMMDTVGTINTMGKEQSMRLVKSNMEQEERSLLWSFCQAADILYEQFGRLEQAGTLSYSLLRSLIGESSQKGLLWYLKDKAHALFEGNAQSDSPGALLDWSLGYIFHESVKLMEDTRLQQAYVVRFDKFAQNCPQCAHLFEQFDEIEKQTRRSIAYEANRLNMLLLATMDLFGQYFSGRVDHRPLARLLFDQEALFRRVFGNRYAAFLQSVYADRLYCLYVEAGNSLLETGKLERAQAALTEALRLSRCDAVRRFEHKLREVSPETGGA